MRNSSSVGRVAAIAAVVLAVIAVGYIIFSRGTAYQVTATFQDASQIVDGDQVQVAGNSIGSVTNIALTEHGLAKITMNIKDSDFQPLRTGTTATIRELSLSGIANRYIDLKLGPATGQAIPNGGAIPIEKTTDEVDLDQIINTLNKPTRTGLQNVIKGAAAQYQDQGPVAQRAFQYLNPAVATTSILFEEINRDTGAFKNFIVKSSNLVTDLSQRSSDLSGLVQNLSVTTEALAAQRTALAQSIQRLPGFMRLANTTFVNLRSALDDLTPLVNASKPVAPKLLRLLQQLRPLAQESVPTVRDLARVIRKGGRDNDLIDLVNLGVPLANATVRPTFANGKTRPGAFPISTTALNASTPELATARPYAVDLTGWFEGFTHPGTIDANGGSSRIAAVPNQLSVTDTGLLSNLPVSQQLQQIVGILTGATPSSSSAITTGQGDRCPGSMERGALWYPESGFPCNPSEVPTGP